MQYIEKLRPGGVKRFRCGVPVPSHNSTLMMDHGFGLQGDKGIWSKIYSLLCLWFLFWWLTVQFRFISLRGPQILSYAPVLLAGVAFFLTDYCRGDNTKDKAAVYAAEVLLFWHKFLFHFWLLAEFILLDFRLHNTKRINKLTFFSNSCVWF